MAGAARRGGCQPGAGPDAYKWIMPDQAIFLGQLGPAILLVIGDDEDLVSEGLTNMFDAMELAP